MTVKLGMFTMPFHHPDRDYATILEEDQEAIVLADRLGFSAGVIDGEAWEQTVEIAMGTENETGATIISEEPPETAYSNEYVEQALEELRDEDVDVDGTEYEPIEVTLNEGGS